MTDKNSNEKKDVLYAIDDNGIIFSVPEIEGEVAHFQLYRRLNIKLDNKIGDINQNDTSWYLPNRVAKLGYINIYPLLVFDIEGTGFRVVFPVNKTEKQLKSLKSLYDVLEKKGVISFYKKTTEKNEIVNFDEYEIGLENLKNFVEEELKRIKQNSEKKEER